MVNWFDDAQDEDDEFIEAAKAIKLLALDVDGVLTDGTIYIAADGECFKGFNAKDGMGISCALRNGLDVAIITGRKSEIIHRRAEELGITTIIEGAKDKREALRSLRRLRGLSVEEVAYVGDDLNDLPAFAESGLTFAPD
ncbi:KdsC family phosphatase, partial [Phascolarctobacterium succinatutens]